MDTFKVNSGRTTNHSENYNKAVKIPKTPAKYVFKPEVVRPLAKHGYQGGNCDGNLSKSLQMVQGGSSKGYKSFFTKGKNSDEKNQDLSTRKRSRSLFDNQNSRSTKDTGKWFEPREDQCASRRYAKMEDLREKNKSTNSSKSQKDNDNLRNPEGKFEKNGERCCCSDKAIQDKIIQERSMAISKSENEDRKNFFCLLGKQHEEKNDKFTKSGNEQQHLTNTNELIKNQKDAELKIDINPRVVEKFDNNFPRPDPPCPTINHLEKLPTLVDDQSPEKCPPKTFEERLKNPVKCEGCGELHWPDKYMNFQMEYFFGDGQLQEKEAEKKEFNGSRETPVASLLYRSRSLPQLSVHDSGVGSGNEQGPGRTTSRLVADLRQLLTLKQHYYPEGGWGWIIVVVGVLVQILSHGMHGAMGTLLLQVANRFGPQIYLQAG